MSVFELSKFQESVIASEALFPATAIFNIGGYIRLSGYMEHSTFRNAVHRLFCEMPALRLCLARHESDGQFRQFVGENSWYTGNRIFVTQSNEEALQLMRELVETPFVLESSPLCEIHLFDCTKGQSFIFLKMHHVIGDGLSVKLIAQRFSQVYSALAAGREPDKSIDTLNFVVPSYIEAERKYLASSSSQRAVGYWRAKLADAPDSRGFATLFDNNRSAPLKYERFVYKLPKCLLDQANTFSKTHGNIGIFSLVVSTIYILNHICGNEDFVSGLSIQSRGGASNKNCVGPFINVIPFFYKINPDATFRDLAVLAAAELRQGYRFKRLPLHSLVEALRRKTRIYHVGISYQNFEYGADFDGCESELCYLPNNSQHEDLVFHVMHDADDGLKLIIDARCALFSKGKVDFLGERLISLLGECLANPSVAVRDLEPAAPGERDFVLYVLNNTTRDFPKDRTVMDVIDDQVAATPAAAAVIGRDGTLTHTELACRSKALARYLVQRVGERTVGVFMERSAALVVALHGVIRAGKAYVPISNEFPKSRVEYIRDNAGFGTVLTDQASAELVKSYLPNANVVVVNVALNRIESHDNVSLPLLDPNDWAYVIYTSGSTGQPKGVANVHRSLLNRILWQQREIPIGHSDVVLQKTPYTFDVSVWEFFWPFMTGSSLCMLDPGAHKEPKSIQTAIRQYGVTTLHFVPSMLRLFLEVFDTTQAHSLRNVIVSGEELPVDVQNDFLNRSSARLYNLYGPTEAAIDVTFWCCREDKSRVSVPIGYPIDNTQILILNPYGRILPIGAIGEIHIGGVNVSQGYIGNPALTEEKFIHNPFGEGRLYKTGDLGKWDQQGYVDYHGRIDNQLKLNGLRIELGEIDSRLKDIAWVQDAKTIAHTNGTRKSLVAFCVFANGPQSVDIMITETVKQLRESLPSYMVPSVIVPIDSIPVSQNGKADVKKLASLPISPPSSEYVAPTSDDEKKVAQLMAAVLGVERVGVTDDFFELGGTSLLAISFVNKYDRITLQQFYANASVRGILAHGEREERRLVRLGKTSPTDANIVFVPYGGGTVFVYNDLANAMHRAGTTANMFAVEVDRSGLGIEELAVDVVCEMEREGLLQPSKRLFLFGHCVGSALATAIGLELQSRAVKVEALLVGGYIAGLPRGIAFVLERAQSFIYRKDTRVRKLIKSIGFHDPEALDLVDNEQLFDNFRIDGYRARDFYRKARNQKLDADLYLMLGELDPLTRPVERFMHGWKNHLSGSITVSRIQGAKHYFIHKEAEHVARIVNGVLTRSTGPFPSNAEDCFEPVDARTSNALSSAALETH